MSLIIMAGIISVLPGMFKNLWVELFAKGFLGIAIFALFILVFIGIIVGIIYVETAERRIPIQYANKSTNAFGSAAQSFMPIKINTAGVIPVIFASSLLAFPQTIAMFMGTDAQTFVQTYLNPMASPGGWIYRSLEILLIVFFSYFYTTVSFNTEDISNIVSIGPKVRLKETRVSDNKVIIQTVDFFPPMVDDPYIFGQVAATNALSDVYAMGGDPAVAMNLLCFPSCLER